MQFDPEKFGQAMGDAIKNAVAPLQKKIAELEAQLAALPVAQNGKDGADGKDCDMAAVKAMVEEAVKRIEIPVPANGRDGKDGANGKSVTLADVRPLIDEAVKTIRDESLQVVDVAVKAIPVPKDGRDGRDGKDGVDGKDGRDGKDGERGEKGADGIGMAGAMLDRDGELLITLTNGEVKKLGVVAGKDGRDGKDGADGLSFESFEMDYLEETHEVRLKAAAGGRVKEIRFPAGGITLGGYWRDGSKAKALQVFSHDGNAYIAKCATSTKPSPTSDDWVLMARRGRDGETVVKTVNNEPAKPVKLGKSDSDKSE